ncbi:MAG: hypothetical protein J6S79_02995 [Lachnospiraceae bacterium]|nr:hypothetical protein [Lachnospiraceae bacterium]
MKNMKKVLSLLLVLAMVLSLAACGKKKDSGTDATPTPDSGSPSNPGQNDPTGTPEAPKTYTYKDYADSLGTNWNPHTWENSGDSAIASYIETPLVNLTIENSEEAKYQWIYEAATAVTDTTKDHQSDLTKFGCILPEGKSASDVTEGYIFDISLRQGMKWEDGTAINADTYIYSMQQLLNPEMKNYRANNYWSGDSAIAGAKAYYYGGSTSAVENYDKSSDSFVFESLDDVAKGSDGVYYTKDNEKIYIAIYKGISYLGDDSIGDYVDAYGDAYFNTATWEQLSAMADKNGLVPLTDETFALFAPVISTDAWAEDATCVPYYLVYDKTFEKMDYSTVGLYKVDDYTIRYVNEKFIERNYFLTSLTSNWIVNEKLYEANKETKDGVVTTKYGTSKETSCSYGAYKIASLQNGKQIVFVQNENWFGYTKNADGTLTAMTSAEGFTVDGKDMQQYKATSVVIDIMDENTAKQAFLKGELSSWRPTAEELVNYSTSDQLYKMDETYTMSFFFNTNVDALKAMDVNGGNKNSVVLSNTNFRKAMSLAINRQEFVTATAGYKPAYYILNGLYYYNVYDDPTSIYRDSDEAMQAICNLYGIEYGPGKAYATLKDAYKSVNGYNTTVAKQIFTQACEELVAAGLYTKGEEIKVRIGWSKGALQTSDQAQVALINKQVNAALEGTGFGKITFEAVGNLEDRYKAVPAGDFAIGYGAWGGAAFYPFTIFRVYCDPDYVAIHEAACWDPATETLTINVNGEDVTMTWQKWSNSMENGQFATADFKTKLSILAAMEEAYLGKYYRIPLCGTTICELLSFQTKYYTDEYNIMYDFGGLRLMEFNYDDDAWKKAVADQGGVLSYE